MTVYEKGQIGGEASWAGAGMLAPGGEIDEPSALASRAIESRALYRAFVRELEESTGVVIDYQECGALDLAYDADEWAVLLARAQWQSSLGIRSKILDPRRIGVLWPRVETTGLAGAVFYPDDALVNPRDLVLALSRACRRENVEILEQASVDAVTVVADRALLESKHGLRHYDAVVLAAGAWSGQIPVANVPSLPPSEPIKGHLIGYQQPDQTCNTIIRHGRTYLLQRASGLLIVGASVEHVGWDRSIDADIVSSLADEASTILPHLAETSPSETWIGFRPGSDDLHIGSWHARSLYLAYGHYRNGILLAPLTAREIADQLIANWEMPSHAGAAFPPAAPQRETSA